MEKNTLELIRAYAQAYENHRSMEDALDTELDSTEVDTLWIEIVTQIQHIEEVYKRVEEAYAKAAEAYARALEASKRRTKEKWQTSLKVREYAELLKRKP